MRAERIEEQHRGQVRRSATQTHINASLDVYHRSFETVIEADIECLPGNKLLSILQSASSFFLFLPFYCIHFIESITFYLTFSISYIYAFFCIELEASPTVSRIYLEKSEGKHSNNLSKT